MLYQPTGNKDKKIRQFIKNYRITYRLIWCVRESNRIHFVGHAGDVVSPWFCVTKLVRIFEPCKFIHDFLLLFFSCSRLFLTRPLLENQAIGVLECRDAPWCIILVIRILTLAGNDFRDEVVPGCSPTLLTSLHCQTLQIFCQKPPVLSLFFATITQVNTRTGGLNHYL